MNEVKRRQKSRADLHNKEIDFQIGDPVFLKKHRRSCKLDTIWVPFYRIIAQTGPVSFRIRSQLTGEVTKTHARHLRPADIDEWTVPDVEGGARRHTYVIPPEERSPTVSDNESDEENHISARERVIKRSRQEQVSSDDDTPLAEMKRRWSARELIKKNQHAHNAFPDDVSDNASSDQSCDEVEANDSGDGRFPEDMEVELVTNNLATLGEGSALTPLVANNQGERSGEDRALMLGPDRAIRPVNSLNRDSVNELVLDNTNRKRIKQKKETTTNPTELMKDFLTALTKMM